MSSHGHARETGKDRACRSSSVHKEKIQSSKTNNPSLCCPFKRTPRALRVPLQLTLDTGTSFAIQLTIGSDGTPPLCAVSNHQSPIRLLQPLIEKQILHLLSSRPVIVPTVEVLRP